MKELAKIWIGAAAAAVIYLAMCGIIDSNDARVQQCRVVHCT